MILKGSFFVRNSGQAYNKAAKNHHNSSKGAYFGNNTVSYTLHSLLNLILLSLFLKENLQISLVNGMVIVRVITNFNVNIIIFYMT